MNRQELLEAVKKAVATKKIKIPSQLTLPKNKEAVKHHRKLDKKVFHVDDVENLKEYTHFSGLLNRHLITAHKNKSKVAKKYASQVKSLDKISNYDENKFKTRATLYSGIGDQFHKKLMKLDPEESPRTVHFPAYTSTSIKKSIAAGWSSGHILVFHVPKGYSKGRYVEPHTTHTAEHEVVLGRNQKFKYIGRKEVERKYSWSLPTKKYEHHFVPV